MPFWFQAFHLSSKLLLWCSLLFLNSTVGQLASIPLTWSAQVIRLAASIQVCCEVSSLLRVSGLQAGIRLVAGIGQLGLRTEPFTHKVVQGLPCLSSTEASPFQPAGRRGLPTMPPTKLPATFSLKLLIVSSSKTWGWGCWRESRGPTPLR